MPISYITLVGNIVTIIIENKCHPVLPILFYIFYTSITVIKNIFNIQI